VPTAAEPLVIECAGCGGRGCPTCGQTGQIEIAECPLRIVPREVWRLLELAEMYDKGLGPVAGGTLDQAVTFVEACRQVWADQAVWRNEDEAVRR